MKVSTMRRVDAWVGIPLCAALTVLRKLVSPWARDPQAPVDKILFVKLAEQGSTVLANAALERGAEMVGRENVYFLVFEENRRILDAMQVIPEENVIAVRANGVLGAMINTLKAVFKMRRMRFGAAVDLEFFARSTAIMTYLSGARRRVGLHPFAGGGPWRGDLFTHRLNYTPHLHTSQLFRVQVDAIRENPATLPAIQAKPVPLADLPRARFHHSPSEVAEVEAIVRAVTGQSEVPRIVLLNANCSDLLPLRRWADDNYVELAKRLLAAEPDLWIAFTGAPDEAPPVELLVERIGSERCVSMAGKTTMRQLLVLYDVAEMLVTNDSGPAHFASMSSADICTLFGPETPELFGVLSKRSHVMWAETSCSPCVNAYNNRVSKCTDNICMRSITVDQVYDKVRAVLAHRRAARQETAVRIPSPPPRAGAERSTDEPPDAVDEAHRTVGRAE